MTPERKFADAVIDRVLRRQEEIDADEVRGLLEECGLIQSDGDGGECWEPGERERFGR